MPEQTVDWGQVIDQEAQRQGVDPQLARSVARVESAGKSNAVSPAGAIGIMQLMPKTAKDLGVDPYDPRENIRGGIQYLSQLHKQFAGDRNKVLAAYNAGPSRVNNPPAETQTYQQNVNKSIIPEPPLKSPAIDLDPDKWMAKQQDLDPDAWMAKQQGDDTLGPLRADLAKRMQQGPNVQGFLSGITKPTTWGPPLAAAIPSLLFPEAAAAHPVIALGARMLGAGAASEAAQQYEYGNTSPWTTSLDVAMAGGAPLVEGGVAALSARRQLRSAVAAEEAKAISTIGASKQARAAAGATLEPPPGLPSLGEMGANFKQAISDKYEAAKAAASQMYDDVLGRVGDQRIGPPPKPGTLDTRPTVNDLHERQAKLGNDARDMARSPDPQVRAQAHDLYERRELVQGKIQSAIDSQSASDYAAAATAYKAAEVPVTNPAVQKLLAQADDNVTKFLMEPRNIPAARRTGAIRAGQSPADIIDALKAASDPNAFADFQQGTHAKMVQAATDPATREFDPAKYLKVSRAMGQNFPSLFGTQEAAQKEAAAQAMVAATKQIEASEKIQAGAQSALAARIPQLPDYAKTAVKVGIGGMMGGELLGIMRSPYGSATALSRGTAAITVLSALAAIPPMARTLLESPQARQMIVKAAGAGLQSPLWDQLATTLIHSTAEVGREWVLPAPPGTSSGIPSPPITIKGPGPK